tara:strand:+ start:2312 stop:2899 length:588 start_codon:yes stop_codon:yes gene_type:complete
MIKEQFFPTTIYAKDIKIDNDALANNIINWSKQDKGVKLTNIGGWHSPTDMNTKPEYEELCNALFEMQMEIYKEEFIERKPLLGNMWANINYKDGSYNKPHLHPNSLFSGVYYVKSHLDSGNLTCYDPRPGTHITMPIRKKVETPQHLWNECHMAPIPGRIIMFPAWLWHSVEPNKSDDIRISVSFNFIQEGFNV